MTYGLKMRVAGYLIGATIGSVLCGSVVMIYLAFFDHRVPPIRLSYSHPTTVEFGAESRETVVEVPYVVAGNPFYTFRQFCVDYHFVTLEAQRYLVNKHNGTEIYPLPKLPSRVDTSIGCINKSFGSTVPPEVPSGEYWYKSSTVYMVRGNPVGTFVWEWPDVSVNVAQVTHK